MASKLSAKEILSIIHAGEGYNTEFKERVPKKVKEITEEICAFANSAGGVLLLGVADNNTIKGAPIAIEVFENHVEISNPGGLTSAISLEEFGTKSHSRNPLIFGLFVRINMVEQVGSGIGRMRDLMEGASLNAPQFKTEGMFTVILDRPVEKTVEKTVVIILDAMKENPKITTKELAQKTGLTRRGIEYNLSKLKEENRIKRIGSARGGRWEVLTEE